MEEKALTMEIFFVFDHVPKIFFNESFLIICVDAVHFLPSLHIQYRSIYANVSISVLFFFRWCTFNLFEFLYCQFENLEYLKQRHFNMFHIFTETNWFLSISVCFSNQLLPSFIIFVLFFSTFYQFFPFTFHQLPIFRPLFANVFHSNFSIEMCCFLLSIKHLIFRFIEFICILYDIWLLREIPRIV